MRLRQIEIFHAVYSCGSVTMAAEYLNVSQPSVSKVLRNAEDTLGYKLFDRIKGKMVPTAEAHALFEDVKGIYDQLGALQNRANNLKLGRSGHVRIAVMPALGLDVLPRAIAGFRQKHPDVTFDVSTAHFSEILSSIREQNCDIAIAFNPPALAGIARHPVGRGEFVCVHQAGDVPIREGRVSLAALNEREVVGIRSSGPLSQLLAAHLQNSQVQLQSVVSVQTYYIAKNLVGFGCGIALVDHLTALAGSEPALERTPLEPAIPYEVVALSDEGRPLSRVCANFLRHFREVYAEVGTL
ncbi:LysR family transcriptional regulator [Kordiimonas sp.]|uniref:LysR family transcriptional regulator n=1 Tax=Kordiimonas sp. TaxID=1970157 RepID=UPI003A912F8A